MLNNSVDLSSNLDSEPLMSGIGAPLLKNLIQLLSCSIGWGAGQQITRLVQSNDSNSLKV